MLDPSKVQILNNENLGESLDLDPSAREIVELSKQLHKRILQLKGQFMSDDGSVSYKQMEESEGFQKFKKECEKLKSVNLSILNEIENKAFFINIYNTLTVHALTHKVKDEKTVLQLQDFWQMYAYKIGSFIFSLDDIEHGILRCNQLHPTHKDYFFKVGDPRREFVQKELDPRIHFALNCGAKSCPPIRLFSCENLNDALNMAAKSFCQNDIFIDTSKKQITVSKIFMWYGGDFGMDEKSIMAKIMPFCTSRQQEEFNMIANDFSMTYADYDWNIE